MRLRSIAIAACLGSAATAAAEPARDGPRGEEVAQYFDPNAPPPPQPYGPYAQPLPPSPEQPRVVLRSPSEAARIGRGFFYGGSIFVPIWLGRMNDQVAPGIGFLGRVGFEVGHGFSVEGGFGWMYNPDASGAFYNRDLTDFFFTLGGRYSFLNPSVIVPFVQAAFQLNLFDSCFEDPYGFYYCAGYGSDVTVGFNAGGGLIWEINPFANLEIGMNVTGTTEGDVLDVGRSSQDFWYFLSPFLGFTLYY